MKLRNALTELLGDYPDMLLSDGGTVWSIDVLLDALDTSDNPHVSVSDSMYTITISRIDDDGYISDLMYQSVDIMVETNT